MILAYAWAAKCSPATRNAQACHFTSIFAIKLGFPIWLPGHEPRKYYLRFSSPAGLQIIYPLCTRKFIPGVLRHGENLQRDGAHGLGIVMHHSADGIIRLLRRYLAPRRGCGMLGAMVRGYRAAQPPATFCQPFGLGGGATGRIARQ